MTRKWLFLLIFIPLWIYSENYSIKFNHVSIEDGLSQSTVYAIQQDRKGFIWIGTEDGLNRYDGYQFKVFRREQQLSNNRITAILETEDGIIWIGTLFGLNRFDTRQNRFTSFIFNIDKAETNEITSIIKDRRGILWVGTDKGIYLLKPGSDQFETTLHQQPITPLLTSSNILKLYEDNSGYVWIGTLKGLTKLAIGEKKITPFHFSNERLTNNYILAIAQDRSHMWIGTARGLNRIDRQGNIDKYIYENDKPQGISNNFISAILVDSRNDVWIGTIDGLNRFNRSENTFASYRNDHRDPHSISDNSILSLFEDSFGVIWIGTNLGINKFDRNKINFIHYRAGRNNRLSHSSITALLKGKSSKVYIGTENGLNLFDPGNGRFNGDLNDKILLNNHAITSLCIDNRGNTWIGTVEKGIKILDSHHQLLNHYFPDSKTGRLSSGYVKAMLVDRSDRIWIGTDNGLNRHLEMDRFKKYIFKNPNPDPELNSIEALCEAKDGGLLIGTDGGGFIKLGNDGDYRVFRFQSNNENDNTVLSVLEDSQQRIWLGTKGGLKQFLRAGQYRHYREKDGLPNDDIKALIEDRSGKIWISTNRGLSCFDPEKMSFQNYFLKDGLQGNGFNQNAALLNGNGQLYFGGPNGFNIIKPDSIGINPFPPRIVLTSFKKFNREQRIDRGINNTDEIILSHRDRLISFEFVGLNYSDSNKNRYAWKLEGLNNDWIDLGEKRDITITNLTSGAYTLKIKAANCDNVWTPEGLSLRLVVPTPFYKTPLFFLLLAILFLLLFILFYRLKMTRIKRQKLELERLVQEKTAQLTEANLKLSVLATEDGLTGLTNKRTFLELIDVKTSIARREKKPISIIMLDIDFFKIFNDTLGHQAGDECLKSIAGVLKASVKRPGDVTARYGGEEFIVLLDNTEVKGAVQVANRIKQNIQEADIRFNQNKLPGIQRVTASFGISTFYPSEQYTPDILILAADTALYQAKINGRNCIFVFNKDALV